MNRLIFFVLAVLLASPSFATNHNYEINDLLTEERVGSLECMTYTLYHESRSEPDLSSMMVLAVIWQRMSSPNYPDTICEVVKQDKQFSYLFDGKSDKITDTKTYDHLYRLVETFILNRDIFIEVSENADHYHTTYVNPVWNKSMKRVGVFGDHIFYRRD